MMLEIAREHARRGAKFLRDENGVPRFRVGSETDLLGALIPQSLYWATPKVESSTTYELCDSGIWTRDELEIINRIDRVQACHDEASWPTKLQELLEEYDEGS